jgi:hypothetical protein
MQITGLLYHNGCAIPGAVLGTAVSANIYRDEISAFGAKSVFKGPGSHLWTIDIVGSLTDLPCEITWTTGIICTCGIDEIRASGIELYS